MKAQAEGVKSQSQTFCTDKESQTQNPSAIELTLTHDCKPVYCLSIETGGWQKRVWLCLDMKRMWRPFWLGIVLRVQERSFVLRALGAIWCAIVNGLLKRSFVVSTIYCELVYCLPVCWFIIVADGTDSCCPISKLDVMMCSTVRCHTVLRSTGGYCGSAEDRAESLSKKYRIPL